MLKASILSLGRTARWGIGRCENPMTKLAMKRKRESCAPLITYNPSKDRPRLPMLSISDGTARPPSLLARVLLSKSRHPLLRNPRLYEARRGGTEAATIFPLSPISVVRRGGLEPYFAGAEKERGGIPFDLEVWGLVNFPLGVDA